MKSVCIALGVFLSCAILSQCVWVKEMENPGLYQGDIVLDPDEWERINKTQDTYASIKGGRWPGARVPYVITSSIGQRGREAIAAAIAEYHKHTCLKFFPRTNEDTYISFYRGSGCSSPVGYRRGRVNHISLATGCWWTGTTIHEIGHSMGFHHEQNRPDRDKFVVINWNNIQQGLAYAFYKQPAERIDSLGTPYDLESTMHYGTYAFSKNRRPTIVVKDSSKQGLIRDNRGFSKIDIIQLNLMYCNGKTMPPPVCDNKNPRCEEWAKRGECHTSHGQWMAANCCKACKEFGGTGGTCVDKDKDCQYWAQHGYCRGSHGPWMKENCCKSCTGK